MKQNCFHMIFTAFCLEILLITACAPAPAALAPAIPTATVEHTVPTLFHYTPTATTAPDVVISVTFSPGSCNLDNPAQVVEGTLGIKVVDNDPTKVHSVAVVTLDPGKTFADLDAYPSAIPPEWVNVFGYAYLNRPEDQLVATIKKDTTYYLVCLNDPDKKVGTLGPIQTGLVQTQIIATPTPFGEQMNLLIISDSSNWGVGPFYAKLIEQDLKVKVNLNDCWIGGLSIKGILDKLQNGMAGGSQDPTCMKTPWVDLVRRADLMVLFGGPQESRPPDGAWDVPESYGACVEGGYQGRSTDPAKFAVYKEKMLQSCAPETWATYEADLRAVLDEIIKIREGKPLIVRMTDHYIAPLADYRKEGMADVCTTCLEMLTSSIHKVAQEYGVVVASSKDALNGKDRQTDPKINGYLSHDGIHLSDSGAEVVANALQQSGYTYWSPKISP